MYQRLFELIRQEEVVLFVGAGFSVKAGYPSGKDLSQIIYNSLNATEKEAVSSNLPLSTLAEEFVQVRLGLRNPLIQILKEIYSKNQVDLTDHLKVKSIPHIKNIITTNYDSSFEKIYDDYNLVFGDVHCAYLNKNKPSIFKIHGDLSEPNSVIITNTDYRHFFTGSSNPIFWTKIKDILSSSNVLFIGYSFEDDNIISIYEKINERLGSNRKEMFLIAPNWHEHKKQKLSKFDIKYFDDTADNFFIQLTENIKNNIKGDYEKKKVSSETFSEFCKINNIAVDINVSEDRNNVINVKPLGDKLANTTVTFTVDAVIANRIKNGEFENNNLPIKIGENVIGSYPSISIPVEQLHDFKYKVNDILFSSKEDISQFIIVKAPSKKGVLSIKAPDNSYFGNIKYDVFGVNLKEFLVKAYTPHYTIVLNVNIGNNNDLYFSGRPEFNDLYKNKHLAIYWTELLHKIYAGGVFKFYLDDEEFIKEMPISDENDSAIKLFKNHIQYYENISEIERILKRKFKSYNKYTDTNFQYSCIVLKYLRKEFELLPAKNYIASFTALGDSGLIENYNQNPDEKFVLFQTEEIRKPININGHVFDVKYKNILYFGCKILNIEIKEDGVYRVEFQYIEDNIQITYTEKPVKQEGLKIRFFD